MIAISQVYWAKLVEDAIMANKLPELYEQLVGMLNDLVGLVRGKLTPLQRMMMSALIVIEVTSQCRHFVALTIDPRVFFKCIAFATKLKHVVNFKLCCRLLEASHYSYTTVQIIF